MIGERFGSGGVALLHGANESVVREMRLQILQRAATGVAYETVLSPIGRSKAKDAPPPAAQAIMEITSLSMIRRLIVVDGCETLDKDGVEKAPKGADGRRGGMSLADAINARDPQALILLVGIDGKQRTPKALSVAVQAAGGRIVDVPDVKGPGIHTWVDVQCRRVGIALTRDARSTLLDYVGEEHPVQLAREIEKLAVYAAGDQMIVGDLGPADQGVLVEADDVRDLASDSAGQEVWPLIESLMVGDRPTTVDLLVALHARGEPLPKALGLARRRARDLLRIRRVLDAGGTDRQAGEALQGAPWVRSQRVAEAKRTTTAYLLEAMVAMADLESLARGGSEMTEATAAARCLTAIGR